MKNDLTPEMLAQLIAELSLLPGNKVVQLPVVRAAQSPLMKNLLGKPLETPAEAQKLQQALLHLPPDVGRGQGAFYDVAGHPEQDNWLACIWAIASLEWSTGESIARDWSMKCPERYDEQGFDTAWNSYKPNHPNPVGVGSLYKRAKELGWQPLESVVTPPNTARYKLLGSADLHKLTPVAWCIKGIYPSKGLCALYGSTGSGKSFLGFDQAAAIAEGRKWFGYRTKITTVVYVVLEGEAGIKNRAAAWELENKRPLPANLDMVMQPFKVIDSQDVSDLASVVPSGSVVFIDTLNRTAPTADENSSKDMGQILEGAKNLQNQIDGLVVLVHHTGKDTSKGARGHSSFFAALDGAIEVERTNAGRAWSVAKAKDGQDGNNFPFELKFHVLGKDSDGDEISSCTIQPALPNIFAKPQPKGPKQRAALKQIKKDLATSGALKLGLTGCPPNEKCLTVEDAVICLSRTLATTLKSKRTNEARRLLTALTNDGYLGTGLDANGDAWCWIPR